MRVTLGHKIVCDGSFQDAKGNRVPCEEELHPETRAVINKAGVLGHHCSLCADPAATAILADKLGVPEYKLRKMSDEQIENARKTADERDKQIADNAVKNGEIDTLIANLAAEKDGSWVVFGKPYETKKAAIEALENERPDPVKMPKKNGNGNGSAWPPAA